MHQSENLDQLFTALAKAQGEMLGASKDCANPFFKSKYADLSSVWTACREPLSKNGLTVLQTVQQNDQGDVLFTMLGHTSGQWISSTMPIRIKMEGKGGNELQALGAAITYLRRFSLSALVGVAPDDDNDGNTAANYKTSQKSESKTVAPPISESQCTEIKGLLSQCEEGFRLYITQRLAQWQISNIESLPVTYYDNVKGMIAQYFSSKTKAVGDK